MKKIKYLLSLLLAISTVVFAAPGDITFNIDAKSFPKDSSPERIIFVDGHRFYSQDNIIAANTISRDLELKTFDNKKLSLVIDTRDKELACVPGSLSYSVKNTYTIKVQYVNGQVHCNINTK